MTANITQSSETHDAQLLEAFFAELHAEFPAFRIVPKETSTLSRTIDVALRIITLGGQNRFMTEYHTVIGATLYVPHAWQRTAPRDKIVLLRHERVHLRQRRRFGFLLMAWIYLVPFLPLGLAYGRARLEWEAYEETLRATADLHGLAALQRRGLRDAIVRRFTGPDYGWMWPFPRQVESWYERSIQQILADYRPPNRETAH
jgi:hypothetical protein